MSADTSVRIKPIPADAASFAKVLDRRPVLWVGAGLSIAAGYPGTGKLVDALVAAADDPIDKSLPFYQVVDEVVASVGKGRVRDVLQGLFQPARPPTPTHRAIARLAKAERFAAILTTNYDDLLERALAEAGAPYVLQPLDDNETVVGPGVRVHKVHGSYDDWERVVLSGESYEQFGKQYPFLRSQLDVLLRQRPVLFTGCSLQDPRILDWIAALPDDAAEGLKEWRVLLTAAEWKAATEHTHEGAPAVDLLARALVRPLIVHHHDHARELFVNAAGALPTPAEVVALDLTVAAETLSAAMAGAGVGVGAWTPVSPLRDARFVTELRELRERDHLPLPTDDLGHLAPAAAHAAARLRVLAERVGRALTDMLSPAAQQKLAQAVATGLGAVPPLLHVRVHAGTSAAERQEADRLLGLPWELVLVDGQFPVERGTLDVAREAVMGDAPGLTPPDRPLSVVAAVSAPVDASRLDHEGECYRLWLAMGAEERRLHLTDTGTLEAMFEAMERTKPAVLHFTGHGEPGALLFEDDEACQVTVPVRTLVDGLRLRAMPRLAFLASCHGASVARGEALRAARGEAAPDAKGDAAPAEREVTPEALPAGVSIAEDPVWSSAAELQREGIPQVVGWFGPVGDAQSTRAEEVFYGALVQGKTARQAVREARHAGRQPLRSHGQPRTIYPLGWAQLALYHRGPDEPTALPASAAPAPARERERVGGRLDVSRGPVGVEQLKFGFVGRRSTRAEVLRRVRDGQRLLVVHGLGGLGKTALVSAMVPMIARKIAAVGLDGEPAALPVVALDGRFAGKSADPMRELWDQVARAMVRWKPEDSGWETKCGQVLAVRQKDGLTGDALAGVLDWLAAQAKGLVVYLDDAESLQAPAVPGGDMSQWRDEQLGAFWDGLARLAAPHGRVAVLASTRFLPRGLPHSAAVSLPVMAKIDLVHLLSWWPTLGTLGPTDTAWLVDRLDGHPRSVEWLEALTREKAEALVPSGQVFKGNLRREVIEPVLPSLDSKIDADLLLPQLLAAVGPAVRDFVRRLGVLAQPAPWAALLVLEETAGTAKRAQGTGLVSPFEGSGREPRWAPHRMVLAKAGALDADSAKEAHHKLGEWFRTRWPEQRAALALAQDAAYHLCEAGEGTAAWEPARRVLLALRRVGRYREALTWVRRVLAAKPTGAERGNALAFQVQLGLLANDLPADPEGRLREAESLVERVDRNFVLNELAKLYRRRGDFKEAAKALTESIQVATKVAGTEEHSDVATSLHNLAGVLQAQGDLPGAREHLERSLRISARVFGTEEHPSVAASLHELARVLQAQGDLPGAREHLERSLRISAKVFGTEEHPSVAASLHALAGVLQAQGDLPGAREHLERSLRIKAKVFGTEEHPSVAASLHELAGVLQAQGDLLGAREHLERSLRIQAKVFGTEEHPDVATSLHSLAGVLQAQGDLPGAREHLERSLRISARVFGTEEHPSVAASLHELARVLQAQGDLPGAREHLERSLRIKAKVFGTEEHPSVAASLHALAGVLQAQGDLPGAREHLERVLAIEKRLYGGREHYSTAITETNLGMLLAEMGEREDAVRLLVHAYQVFLAQLGPEHPYTQQLAQLFGR